VIKVHTWDMSHFKWPECQGYMNQSRWSQPTKVDLNWPRLMYALEWSRSIHETWAISNGPSAEVTWTSPDDLNRPRLISTGLDWCVLSSEQGLCMRHEPLQTARVPRLVLSCSTYADRAVWATETKLWAFGVTLQLMRGPYYRPEEQWKRATKQPNWLVQT
jgi:hypothetical protein